MENSSLIGTTQKLTNALVQKRASNRVVIADKLEDSVEVLGALLRSDMSITVKTLYAAYCHQASIGHGDTDEVTSIIREHSSIDFSAVSKLSSLAAVSLKAFGRKVSEQYYGCTQAEKSYMNEIIKFVLTKRPSLGSIFDKCLTSSELKKICS